MEISYFNTDNLFDATTILFADLGVRLNSHTELPMDAQATLKVYYKDREPFINIRQLYFAGMIDNSIFENNLFGGYTFDEAMHQANLNYDGLMLFAIELSKHPTRTEISELTRVFNRLSQKRPVALLFKYENAISIALSERFIYKQEWRQGEKAGKVIILRDILIEGTHAGHVRILQDLKEHKATNYNELHKAWLEVLDVNVLNKKLVKDSHPINISFYELFGAMIPVVIFLGFTSLGFSEFPVPRIFGESEGFWTNLGQSDLLWLVILAWVCTAYPFAANVHLMKKLSAFSVTFAINFEPIYSIALAFLIFGESERMKPEFYIGVAIILVLILFYPMLKSKIKKTDL